LFSLSQANQNQIPDDKTLADFLESDVKNNFEAAAKGEPALAEVASANLAAVWYLINTPDSRVNHETARTNCEKAGQYSNLCQAMLSRERYSLVERTRHDS